MKLCLRHLPFVFALVIRSPVQAHDTDSQTGPLGKVFFPASCNRKVQAQFERAVAMLHSFWYSAGETAFRDVLKDDPQCAIARGGSLRSSCRIHWRGRAHRQRARRKRRPRSMRAVALARRASASATTSKPSRPTTRTSRRARRRSGRLRAHRPTRRWPRNTPVMTRRRSSRSPATGRGRMDRAG